MKKSFIIILAVLTSLVANAQLYTTNNAAVLRVDSICLKGNMMDMLVQHVEMYVYNTGDSIYSGYFILDNKTGSVFSNQYGGYIKLPPGQSGVACIPIQLPQGDYTFGIFGDRDRRKENQLGDDIHLSIGPLRKLNFKVDYKFDLMEAEGDDNILWGRRLQGKLSVVNVDSVPYYGGWGLNKYGSEVSYRLKNKDKGTVYYDYIPGNKKFEPGDTINTDLGFNYDFEDGTNYTLEIEYRAPGYGEPVDSLVFTYLAGMSTYWTADGTMKTKEYSCGTASGQYVVVPREAVAVDLRGAHYEDIDVSQANPNCLYYLDSLDNVPQGLTSTCNVIRGGQTPVIRLTDNYDYYCPCPFWSEYVSYTLQPNNTGFGQGPYAETLVLPYDPQGAFFNDINSDDANLHGELLKVLHFKRLWYNQLELEEVNISEMHANNAYIVAVAVKTPVTFYAEHAYMHATSLPDRYERGKYYLTGGTMFRAPTTNTYRYQPETGTFVRQYTDELLPPFRAWICEGDDVWEDEIMNQGGEETDVYEAEDSWTIGDVLYMDTGFDIGAANMGITTPVGKETVSAIYSLNGTIVNSKFVNSKLPKGLYIVGGKKIVVR